MKPLIPEINEARFPDQETIKADFKKPFVIKEISAVEDKGGFGHRSFSFLCVRLITTL